MVENPPPKAGEVGLIPGAGKTPHAEEQGSPRASTTEPPPGQESRHREKPSTAASGRCSAQLDQVHS